MSCSGPNNTGPLLKRLLQKVLTALSHVPICKAGLVHLGELSVVASPCPLTALSVGTGVSVCCGLLF